MGTNTTNISLYKPTENTETSWGDDINTNFDKIDALAGLKFILQVANTTYAPNAQSLGALSSGILKSTTTTGVLSIATAGTDYYAPGSTDVALADGGTNASLTADNGAIVYSTATALALLASTATAGQIIRSGASAAPTWSTATYPATVAANAILYGSSSNVVGAITSAASGVLVTNGSSVPSIATDIPTAVTIGSAYIYRASGTDVPLADGGTNASLTASVGGIVYSTASAMAILSGTATAGQMLQSGASAAPTWSTATFPSTATSAGTILRADGTNWVATTATYPTTTSANQLLYSSSANVVAGLASAASGVLVTDGSSVPSISTNIPTAVTIGSAYIYRVGGTDVSLADGGTGASLADPGADRLMFWDDSETLVAFLTVGNGLTITTTTIAADTASDTVDGVVELATVAETDTGTDATRAVTPDGLAGSNFGEKVVQMTVFDYTTNTATGDGKGYFVIPSSMNGMNLVEVHARVITAGTTNTTDIQIANVTQAADMLTTKITIDSAETGSDTAATAAVIDANNDDVATNDLIRIDVDAISTTAAKGLIVTCIFRLP